MYEKITSWAVAICLVLLPIFIVPFTDTSFFMAKFGLVTLVGIVAVIAIILRALSDRKIEKYPALIYSALFSLPLVYIVSALFGAHSSGSLMGNGSEIDTAYFFCLGSVLAYLISGLYRSRNKIFMLALSMSLVGLLVSIFHVLRFVFGKTFLSFGLFNAISSNTVGGFNDLGIYAGLIAIISLLSIELLSVHKILRVLLYVTLVLSLAIVAVANFNFINDLFGLGIPVSLSALIALFALIVFIHKKVTHMKNSLPVASLVTLLIALVLTIAVSPISSFISSKIGLTQDEVLDIRVSPSLTADMAIATYSDSLKQTFLGTGPNKFYTAWALHKPTVYPGSINGTVFWNTDFNLASGFVPTSFVSTGVLGVLAWLLLFSVIVFYAIRLLKQVAKPEKDTMGLFVAWFSTISTLYLWFVAFFFTPGPVILFFAFMFTGLFLATLIHENIISTKEVSWDVSTYWRGFALTLGMILLIVALIYIGFIWSQRLTASMSVQAATRALQKNPPAISEAQQDMLKAVNTYFNTGDLRLASDISLIRPNMLIAETKGVVAPEKLNQEIVSDITFAINAARRAAIDRGASPDYRDWLQLGKVYETATFLGATTTATLAVQSYAEAERLNPTSPVPPYLIGRLYALARNFPVAAQKLRRALDLKPDYTEARDLYNSIGGESIGAAENAVVKTAASSATSTSGANSATSTKTKK